MAGWVGYSQKRSWNEPNKFWKCKELARFHSGWCLGKNKMNCWILDANLGKYERKEAPVSLHVRAMPPTRIMSKVGRERAWQSSRGLEVHGIHSSEVGFFAKGKAVSRVSRKTGIKSVLFQKPQTGHVIWHCLRQSSVFQPQNNGCLFPIEIGRPFGRSMTNTLRDGRPPVDSPDSRSFQALGLQPTNITYTTLIGALVSAPVW